MTMEDMICIKCGQRQTSAFCISDNQVLCRRCLTMTDWAKIVITPEWDKWWITKITASDD